ncbi:large conductance mechanosensitive channel protein MscL [Ilumatobacter sp.]|uniref:large conductance mechanosensitive channel protein MscL n=1 Tax=Ilumatobacter sp. TaxID=1967498 RepID=UPI003B519A8B
MIKEFKDFITRGNILEVAIGLVMALYFQKIVDAVLEGVIYPIIAAVFRKPDFRAIGFDLGEARVSIGLVIDAIVSFLIVAFVLFLILRAYNAARGPQDTAEDEPIGAEVALLTEIRDELRASR